MDEPKPPAPETQAPKGLAEVPDEIPEGLLEADGTFVPDYDPPPRPSGVWVMTVLAAAVSLYSIRQALVAVTEAELGDFLINAAAAWAYGFAALGLLRGDGRGHTVYTVLLLVNLAVASVGTVLLALAASNALPSLVNALSSDELVREFVRNAALALVASFALMLGIFGLMLTYLDSDRVREWVGKDAG